MRPFREGEANSSVVVDGKIVDEKKMNFLHSKIEEARRLMMDRRERER